MAFGRLTFILRTGVDALPVDDGEVELTDEAGDKVFEDEIAAGDLGVSGTAVLDAPERAESLDPQNGRRPYSLFDASVYAPGYYRVKIKGVKVFAGTTAVVPPSMVPLPAGVKSPYDVEPITLTLPGHAVFTGRETAEKGTARDEYLPAVQILQGVYIPSRITVHPGAPDAKAENVTLPFVDYIKNVAANEIYPTWPEEALKANVLAQISIALNRVYTEWYRSRGYDFDITASTAYDQAFAFGSNTYAETDAVVDSIFNNYLVRPGHTEPLFAAFCDGRKTVCNGLSQWGSVSLAEDGRSVEEIVGFYYGDVRIASTEEIRDIEYSYPGSELEIGSEGEAVRTVQYQLNRIAVNYPRLPLNSGGGLFDESMAETVSEFQTLFDLPVTGRIDKATWYRIQYLYTSVKQLAELTSEGQRYSYNEQTYPGEPLGPNDKGSEVQEMQFYLRRISRFNPLVRPVNIDGIFDADTAESVKSFQRAYRMEQNGIIDYPTWEMIVRVYNGTLENIDEPVKENGLSPYPGADITYGSRGEQVEYVQRLLKEIRSVFALIPDLNADGFFGEQTERALNVFSAIFAFPQDGRVTEPLWNELNLIYLSVAAKCIFATTENDGARPFPAEVASGSPAEDVLYVQRRINRIYTAIPYVGQLAESGEYNKKTAASVGALQRVFGLTETGKVNRATWDLLNYITAATENGCLPRDIVVAPAMAEPERRQRKTDAAVIKELLRKNGVKTGRGPFWGLKSRRALALWQAENGLNATGMPDEATEKLLGSKLYTAGGNDESARP